MEIAVFGDVHGNAVALDAVVADIENEQPDEILCLGDVAEGPRPAACLDHVRDLDCPVVMGNADENLLASRLPPDDDIPRKFHDISEWSTAQLADGQLDFVRSFEPTHELVLADGVRLFACHGSPASTTEGVEMTMDVDELDGRFDSVDADVLCVGHTHTPFYRRHRARHLLNPGSVGLPVLEEAAGAVGNPPWAEYAIVSVADGRTGVELRRTSVDVDAIIESIETSGMPHADWWADEWRTVTA